jgi:hypothetical protein
MSNNLPDTQEGIVKEGVKELYILSLHTNRIRAIANRNKSAKFAETIHASLSKTKEIIETTLKEIDS